VVDFPPRRTVDETSQGFLRTQFRQAAAAAGLFLRNRIYEDLHCLPVDI